MNQREVGISGFSWHKDDITLAREAAYAAELGYSWVYGDGEVWDGTVLETAHRIMGDENLKFRSVHGVSGVDSWQFDIDATFWKMSEQVSRTGALGIPNITFHTMINDTNREPAPIVAANRMQFTLRFHELFRRLAPLAESCNVSMNVENVGGDYDSAYRTADEVLSITEPVGSPAMGVCLDSGHAHLAGLSVADMIRRLGPKLRETHFHDNRGNADFHQPVGIGTIDWIDVLAALDEISYPYPVIFEWPGTYWLDIDFEHMAKSFYMNWRNFEQYAEEIRKYNLSREE